MSGITAASGYSSSLASLLAQAEGGGDSTLVDSLIAGQTQSAAQDDATSSATTTGSSSDLQSQIQSAVTAALQSAEDSGSTDLKGTVYNALVQVLSSNGIDPKTFQPIAGSGQSSDPASTSGSPQQPLDSATANVLSQVLTALSGATAASGPLAELTSATSGSQASSDLLSLLPASGSSEGTSDSLAQSLALQSDSQGAAELSSLLSASSGGSPSSDASPAQILSSQNNNQDLLGFLFDSGQ
jgi:hypothetical protein